MKKNVKITKRQLIDMLLNWSIGAQPASVQYVTTPKLNKAGEQKFGQVTKIANVGVMLGYNYQNSVNNQRERENELQDFMSQPLWKGKGKRLSPCLAKHEEKGTFYMSYKAQQTFKAFHFDTVLNFIPVALLKPYFPQNDAAKYQGVEKAVYHREILIDNIRKLKFRKTTYEIIPEMK